MAEVIAPSRSRRLPFWAMPVALSFCALAGVFVLLWFKLPTWAPEWVVEHSPWVDPIVRAVKSPNGVQLVERASEALIARGPTVVPLLVSWARQDDFPERELAAAAFARVRDDRFIEPMTMAIIGWDRFSYPDHLVDALSAQDPKVVTDHLLPHLVTGEMVRQALLDVASRLPDERLIPLLTAIMVQPGTWGVEDVRGPFRESAEVAAEALVNSPCRSAVPSLIDAFTGGDEAIRRRVLNGISYGKWEGDPTAAARTLDGRLQRLLVAAMDDADLSVRGDAARLMNRLPISGAEERLIKMSRSMDAGERSCAIYGLHPRWHGENARRRILEALHDVDDRVRLMAVSALDRVEQLSLTSELLDLLSSPNMEIRIKTCTALLRYVDRNDPRLFPAFVKLMEDSVEAVFDEAHYAASFIADTPEKKVIVDEKVRARVKHPNSVGSDE